MVLPAPTIDRGAAQISWTSAEGAVMVAHNAGFDMSFIEKNCGGSGNPAGVHRGWTRWPWRAVLLPGLNQF